MHELRDLGHLHDGRYVILLFHLDDQRLRTSCCHLSLPGRLFSTVTLSRRQCPGEADCLKRPRYVNTTLLCTVCKLCDRLHLVFSFGVQDWDRYPFFLSLGSASSMLQLDVGASRVSSGQALNAARASLVGRHSGFRAIEGAMPPFDVGATRVSS